MEQSRVLREIGAMLPGSETGRQSLAAVCIALPDTFKILEERRVNEWHCSY